MTDPIMTFYRTKDIDACVDKFAGLVEADSQRAQDAHLVRIFAGFLYEGMQVGSISKTALTDTVLNDAAMAPIKSRLARKAFTQELAEHTATSTAAFFAQVQNTVDIYNGKYSREEFINEGYKNFTESGVTIAGVDFVAVEAEVKKLLAKMVDREPSKLLDLERFNQPGYNDLCYVGFGATGNRRYIERVIKALNQGNSRTETDMMVASTAAWSLNSLCLQYTDIDDIIESIPGARRKVEGALERF